MPLTRVALQNTYNWSMNNATSTGFASATQGDQITANLNNLSTTTFNQQFSEQYTLTASGGTATFDLTSFTNLVGESVTLGHVLTLVVQVVSGNGPVNLAPGASNGLQWFFGGSTQSINLTNGDSLWFSNPSTATGTAVTSGAKTMTVTNNGTNQAIVKIAILGSTT